MKRQLRLILIPSLALLALTACQRDELDSPDSIGDLLLFNASTNVGWNNNSSSGTKSEDAGQMQFTDADGNTIDVRMAVIDGIGEGLDEAVETKGLPITSDNFLSKVGNISVYGYVSNTSTVYMGASTFTLDGAEKLSKTGTHESTTYATHWEPSRTYYWPVTNDLDFWSWAPADTINAAANNNTGNGVKISDFTIDNVNGKLTFSYDLGPGDSGTTKGTDAVKMPDILFASNFHVNKSNATAGATGCVPLDFKHALAAVQFRIVSTKPHKLGDIKLIGVTKTGACEYNGSEFNWTGNDATGTNAVTYSHSFDTNLELKDEKYQADLSGTTQVATFMMIPQTIGTQDLGLTVSIDPNSAPSEFTGSIPTNTVSAWEAGKTYIYTIYIDEDTNVTISDEVSSDNVKSNVVIKNTGSTNAYLRATIIGNWCDGKGKIIQDFWTGIGDWTASTPNNESAESSEILSYFNQGLGTPKTDIGTGWIRVGRYYYYRYQVAPGNETVGKLFGSYTPNAENTPTGAHLEMYISVQAIQANYLLGADGQLRNDDPYYWDTTHSSLSTEMDGVDKFPYSLK